LEAALRRGTVILESLLPYAKRQRVALKYYKAAYYVTGYAPRGHLHAPILESAITSLFPGTTSTLIYIKTPTRRTKLLSIWQDTSIYTLRDLISYKEGYPNSYPYVFMHDMRILHDHQTILDSMELD
jgi:hypothetical protein